MPKHLWANPTEVPESDMAGSGVFNREKRAFLDDVLARLVQTQTKYAVRYAFADKAEARAYRTYATMTIRKCMGTRMVNSRVRDNGDVVYVYFTRGDNWG